MRMSEPFTISITLTKFQDFKVIHLMSNKDNTHLDGSIVRIISYLEINLLEIS